MEKIKIAWGITGAGDRIKETKNEMEKIRKDYPVEIHVFVSNAGEQMLKWYKIYDCVRDLFDRFLVEVNPNSPFLAGDLSLGKYATLIIAPTTSNTVAKISNCIGDSLLSNSALMALKSYVPVYVMPTDLKVGELVTVLPSGRNLKVRVRKEDVEHVNKLRETDGVHIIESPVEIKQIIEKVVS